MIKVFSHARGFASNLNHPKITESDLEKGVLAYSQDLLVELDHELTDVFPVAKDLLYYFIDSKSELSPDELSGLIKGSGAEQHEVARVIEFLLYYGILGVKTDAESTYYIFNVNYDLKVLQIRAKRAGSGARYVMNPAFRPALGISDPH